MILKSPFDEVGFLIDNKKPSQNDWVFLEDTNYFAAA